MGDIRRAYHLLRSWRGERRRGDLLAAWEAGLRVLVLLAAGSFVACQSAQDTATQVRDLAAATLEEVGGRVITREERIRLQVEELGATTIVVDSVKPSQGQSSGDDEVSEIHYGLLRSDYARITQTVPTISHAAVVRFAKAHVSNGPNNAEIRLVGCSPAAFRLNRRGMVRGRALTDADQVTKRNVAVVSDTVARELFPDQNPIGAEIRISGVSFAVVGCAARRGSLSAAVRQISGMGDDGRDVYVPVTAFDFAAKTQATTGQIGQGWRESVELDRILFVVQDVSSVEESAEVIDALLRKHHKQRDYSLVVPLQWLREGAQLGGREKRKIVGIDLSGLRLTDSTLAAIENLADLDMLLLDDSDIGDEGLKHLAGHDRLQFLSLRNTNTTNAGVRELQTILPNCAIRR